MTEYTPLELAALGWVERHLDADAVKHVVNVSAVVRELGGTESQRVAALLHDAIEDAGGQACIAELREEFTDDVIDIVEACTDSWLDTRPGSNDGAKGAKEPWWPRKVRYIGHIRAAHEAALLVCAADKIDNLRRCITQYDGDNFFRKFNGSSGRDGQYWYYRRVVEELRDRGLPQPVDSQLTALLADFEGVIRSRTQGPDLGVIHASWRAAEERDRPHVGPAPGRD